MKIQHVLGHFQKDFEGGVSAENLGKLKQSRKMALFFVPVIHDFSCSL